MAQTQQTVGGSGPTVKEPEKFWKQSKGAKEKGENRYYCEYEHIGIIKNLDGTFTELSEVLDPKDDKKRVYDKDGITYYIWSTKDDNTGQDKHLVQRVPSSEYKGGGGGKGGKGWQGQTKRIIDSKLILQGVGLETLKTLTVDGNEIDCALVSEYLSGKKGWDWAAPGTSASDVLKHVFVDEINQQLVLVYNVVKKEKTAGASEAAPAKPDEKKAN